MPAHWLQPPLQMPMRADQSEEPLLSSSAPPGEMWVMETGPGKHPRGDTPLPRTVSRHGSRGTVFPKGTDWRISFVRWYCCALQCLIRCPCLTSCTYSHSAHDFVLDLCVCGGGSNMSILVYLWTTDATLSNCQAKSAHRCNNGMDVRMAISCILIGSDTCSTGKNACLVL